VVQPIISSAWCGFDWRGPESEPLRGFACPNCGSLAPKPPWFGVAWWSHEQPRVALPYEEMFRCEACDARFLRELGRTSSGEHERNPPFRLKFYVQQTAGLETMARLVGRMPARPGARYLDVGCNYGFTLDFARAAKGWLVAGIDPSANTAIGARALDVEIEPRLLAPADAARIAAGDAPPFDFVSAVEVIEHLGDPRGFVTVLRGMLAPGGVLALSTPNAARVKPGAGDAEIAVLLAHGNHVVMHTSRSLAHLLRVAGFTHVAVEDEGMGLSAYASDAPLTLERDPARLRRAYRDWLEAAVDRTGLESDAFLGLAGRALVEAANDGDAIAAARAWDKLRPAIAARYGFDPAGDLPRLPAHAADLMQVAPFNLGVLVYAQALGEVVAGADRAALADRFHAAARLCDEIRAALAAGGFPDADAQSKDLGWVAAAEALVCDVAREDGAVVRRLRSLPESPDGNPARRASIAARLLIDAVNRGFFDLARALHAAEQPVLADPALAAAYRTASARL